MTLAAEIAGIPIALPQWTEYATYVLLFLLAAAIGVWIWRTIVTHRDRTQLGEIHAKTSLILMILRGWQNGDPNADPDQIQNEHYAADPNEVTTDHGRLIQ